MKTTYKLFLAALTLAGCAQLNAANLVINGSFEQGLGGIGSFTGWTTVLGDPSTFVDSTGQTGSHFDQASDGLWSAYFGTTAASGGSSIGQALSTTANQTYLLTFDVANDNNGLAAVNSFVASIAGNPLFSLTNAPAQDYTHEQFLFTAAGAQTLLGFSSSNDQSYFQLDNVSVTATPEPSALFLAPLGIAFALLAKRRSS